MMGQQTSNKGYNSWTLSLDSFKTYLVQTYQFLKKLSAAVKKIGLPSFPLVPFLYTWHKFTTLVEQRITVYSNSAKSELLISTAFNWVLPEWATTCIQIQLFEKRYCEGIEGDSVNMSVFEQVWKQMDLHVKCNVVEGRVQDLFQVPFFFLEQLMVKGLELASSLEQRLRSLEGRIDDETNEAFMNVLSTLQIQTRSLQLSLAHLNSIFNAQKQPRNIQNHQMIRYEYIINSYEALSIQQKKIGRKFGARIKFIMGMRAIEKRRKKLQEQRRMAILQLIKGEQNYIMGLTEYISKIKQPIQRLQILSREKILLLFSSIVQIKTLHQDLLFFFLKQFQKYEHSQCYAPIFMDQIPFFKVYTDYILNAESAQKFMKHLIAQQSSVAEICKQYTAKTSKLAENELLQPTFRIARYEMIFQEIIKKTSRSHPDYLKFQDVQTAFKKMLTQVNNEVDGVIRRMKLNELDREFATPQLQICGDSREFLAEYQLFNIKQSHLQPVTLIVLSDLLLIVDEPSRKLMKCIPVDEQFFARRQEDNKVYRNMVTIHSDGFTTFTFGNNDDLLAGRADQLYSILRGVTKESGQLVYITVLGTQEIGSTSFAKYTEYIVEVKYLEVKKLLHVRFSTIIVMVSEMQAYYKDSLKVTQQESLRKSWFNSHKSKIIQARKRTICQIFQRLFNHPLIKRDPTFFLNYINFRVNFYEVARTSYQRRISLTQTVSLSGLKRNYLTKKQEREAFTILCGTEIKLGRDLFHDYENDEQLKKVKENLQKIEIKVITLDQEQPNIVRITEYDTVEDVCNRLSKLIGLRSNRDFRLFHQIGKKQLRVLQHQQIITKLFQFPQQQAQTGFYATLRRWVFAQAYPTLIFKKYYYLPFDIELAEIKKDLVRLRLMTYQVFSQVRDMKYQLSYDEYLLFLAMRLFIEAEGNINKVEQISTEVVHRVIPQTIIKLKNYSQQEWLLRCRKHVIRLGQQISRVAEHNHQQHRKGKIHADTVSKQSLYFTPKHLCNQIVINKIKTNHLFGTNLFYVQPHKNTYAKLENKGLKVSFNMWLAVSVDSLQLLAPSSKESVFELKYEDIGKVEVFSQAILLKTSSAFEEQYRLNTYQSFQISQLVKYNQALNYILAHLRQDSQLNSRVKQYRDQLIQYRSTFNDEGEKHEPISFIRY